MGLCLFGKIFDTLPSQSLRQEFEKHFLRWNISEINDTNSLVSLNLMFFVFAFFLSQYLNVVWVGKLKDTAVLLISI